LRQYTRAWFPSTEHGTFMQINPKSLQKTFKNREIRAPVDLIPGRILLPALPGMRAGHGQVHETGVADVQQRRAGVLLGVGRGVPGVDLVAVDPDFGREDGVGVLLQRGVGRVNVLWDN
jgi:hypothetical protein